jgi:hypothetical protein
MPTEKSQINEPRVGLKEQKERKRSEAEARKQQARVAREKAGRLAELEGQIAALEGRQKELAAALEDPAAYEAGGRAMEINRELAAVSESLNRLNLDWENATASGDVKASTAGL